MIYRLLPSMDATTYKCFLSLCEACNNYEPYYSVESDELFIQAGAFEGDSLVGFACALVDPDSCTLEFSGMVHSDFRKQGHFRKLLGLCMTHCHELFPDFIAMAPIAPSKTVPSIMGDVLFSEHLFQLDGSAPYTNLSYSYDDSLAEFFMEEDCFLMYLPESEEPVAVLNLDFQKTFVNVYGVFVDENLRGMGVGSCLMKHFLDEYWTEFSLPLVLNVTSNNTAAVALYKKCGFAEASRIDYRSLIV